MESKRQSSYVHGNESDYLELADTTSLGSIILFLKEKLPLYSSVVFLISNKLFYLNYSLFDSIILIISYTV